MDEALFKASTVGTDAREYVFLINLSTRKYTMNAMCNRTVYK